MQVITGIIHSIVRHNSKDIYKKETLQKQLAPEHEYTTQDTKKNWDDHNFDSEKLMQWIAIIMSSDEGTAEVVKCQFYCS